MNDVDVCVATQQEIFAKANFGRIDELISPDVVSHTAPPGSPQGHDGIRAVVGWLHSGLDDIQYDAEDAFAAGDRVVIRCIQSATQARDWMGHAATGRRYSVQQIHIYRMVDGRIAEHWANRDDLGMFRQLGFVD